MKWTDAEIDIVLYADNRADAYKKIRAAGYKRTQCAVWFQYRIWKGTK